MALEWLLSIRLMRVDLLVRYQLADISRLHRRYYGRPPQFSLALLSFARKQMALKTFVPLDLAAARDSKSFGRSSVGFYLGHLILLLSNLVWSPSVISA